jgi:uncharacterized protein (DUF1778 family)
MARKTRTAAPAKPDRKRSKAAEPTSTAPETTTISTRLTTQHRELIEKAAGIANVSPAKFIRQAAVDRAADVINADGDSVAALRRLAQLVVEQLQNPVLVEYWDSGAPDDMDSTVEHVEFHWQDLQGKEGFDSRRAEHMALEHHGHRYMYSMPKPLSDVDREQLHMAMRTAGSAVVQLILEQWQSAFDRPNDYRPTVWKDRIEGGDIDE